MYFLPPGFCRRPARYLRNVRRAAERGRWRRRHISSAHARFARDSPILATPEVLARPPNVSRRTISSCRPTARRPGGAAAPHALAIATPAASRRADPLPPATGRRRRAIGRSASRRQVLRPPPSTPGAPWRLHRPGAGRGLFLRPSCPGLLPPRPAATGERPATRRKLRLRGRRHGMSAIGSRPSATRPVNRHWRFVDRGWNCAPCASRTKRSSPASQ